MTQYAVNLEELDHVVGRAGTLTQQVDTWLRDLDAMLSRLQERWSGEAATAQLEAHKQWAHGAQQMRDALDELRLSAQAAHTNYSSALSANREMWQ